LEGLNFRGEIPVYGESYLYSVDGSVWQLPLPINENEDSISKFQCHGHQQNSVYGSRPNTSPSTNRIWPIDMEQRLIPSNEFLILGQLIVYTYYDDKHGALCCRTVVEITLPIFT